jgi:O-glycosyl hydrolase
MLWVFGVILSLFTLVFAGCELGAVEGKEKKEPLAAEFPVIKQQPTYEAFYSGDLDTNPIKISVDASLYGVQGTLSYQWYTSETKANSGGTPIGTNNKEVILEGITEPGTYYFYVEITNTYGDDQTATTPSEPITIIIKATETVTNFNNTVTVNITDKQQYVRGFGGMSTPWDNAPDDNLSDFETMFNPNNLGYNISRIMIPPHDTDIKEGMRAVVANESVWSGSYFFETNNLPVRNKDHSYYYEKVKIVNKYGGYVLASPWSPPAEWKTNESMNGGTGANLKTDNYADFTDYLKYYCEIMAENGAPIYTVSLQNEFTYPDSAYEGCNYSDTQHVNWWKQAGNYLNGVKGYGGGREIPKVQAMSGESHNEISRLNAVLNNSEVRGYINLMGRHIYGSGITDITFINNAQKHATDPKEIWMSEHNINSGAGQYENDSTWNYVWPLMNEIDYTLRLNYESAFIWWTAKRFYSMIGDATYGTRDGEILPRGHGLSHFAKFAKETGRVGVTVEGDNAASVNPNSFSSSGNKDNPNTGAKIMAFVTLKDDFYAKPVETRYPRWRGVGGADAVPATLTVADITAISLVMFTPTTVKGENGTNMQTVKIQLPSGFTIRSATAMRSNNDENVRSKYEEVKVGTDKNTAYVDLPASTILSVRFTK